MTPAFNLSKAITITLNLTVYITGSQPFFDRVPPTHLTVYPLPISTDERVPLN